jgi:hypothetical protein
MKNKHNFDLETMTCFDCEKPIDASSYVKAKGLINIKQLMELTGRDRSTLNRWFKNDFQWFEIVVDGCLVHLNKGN